MKRTKEACLGLLHRVLYSVHVLLIMVHTVGETTALLCRNNAGRVVYLSHTRARSILFLCVDRGRW